MKLFSKIISVLLLGASLSYGQEVNAVWTIRNFGAQSTNLFETTNVVLLTSLTMAVNGASAGNYYFRDGYNTNATTRGNLLGFTHSQFSNGVTYTFGGNYTNISVTVTNFAGTDPLAAWTTNVIKTNVWQSYTITNAGTTNAYRLIASGATPTTPGTEVTVIDPASSRGVYIMKGLNFTNSSSLTSVVISATYIPVL